MTCKSCGATVPHEGECSCRPPVSGEPHRAEQDVNMTIADGMSRCVCGRMIAEVGTVNDRHWLHVEEPWNITADRSMHVHHWGDDGKCMYPRCDFVAGEPRTPLAIIRDWDTGDHNAHNCPGAYEPCDGAHVIIEQIERAEQEGKKP